MMETQVLIYQFDGFTVDLAAFRVTKNGQPVQLEPKAVAVLAYLSEHPGRLVTKSELLDAVWKDTAVTENALTRVIAQLRKGLGDDAREARYIETVPTRGYRFLPEVSIRQDTPRSGSPRADQTAPVEERPASAPSMVVRKPGMWRSGLVFLAFVIVAAGIAFVWRRRVPPIQLQVVTAQGVKRMTQVTAGSGLDLHPAFSPDGKGVAYVSDKSGSFEIYIRKIDRGGRETQITSDGGQNFQPTWSPDGQFLAYHSKTQNGIWVIPSWGGRPRRLTDFGSNPAWSPDGTRIVFQSDGISDLAPLARDAMPPSTLWSVPVRGGAPVPLTRPGTPAGGHGAPCWMPDGSRILFTTQDIRFSQIWSVRPDGSDPRALVQTEVGLLKVPSRSGAPIVGLALDPIVAADGRTLYFSSVLDNFRLWRLPLGETGEPAGPPVEIANTGEALDRSLSISPDGRRLAVSRMSLANNLWTVFVNGETGEPVGPAHALTDDTHRRKAGPLFSSDGEKIAYKVIQTGEGGESWVSDADGRNAFQLPAGYYAWGWLPNSHTLVCLSDRQGNWLLVEYNTETGAEKVLSPIPEDSLKVLASGSVGVLALSPDGRNLAFNIRKEGAINTAVLDVTTGAFRQVTFDQELMGFPTWSSDGTMLSVEMKRGPNTYLAIIRPDGGAPVQLTNHVGLDWTGGWSPDDRRISFAGFHDNLWNLYWVSRDGATTKKLTNFTKPNIYVRAPSWSPKGNQLVFEYGESKGNIWMLDLE